MKPTILATPPYVEVTSCMAFSQTSPQWFVHCASSIWDSKASFHVCTSWWWVKLFLPWYQRLSNQVKLQIWTCFQGYLTDQNTSLVPRPSKFSSQRLSPVTLVYKLETNAGWEGTRLSRHIYRSTNPDINVGCDILYHCGEEVTSCSVVYIAKTPP